MNIHPYLLDQNAKLEIKSFLIDAIIYSLEQSIYMKYLTHCTKMLS